MDYSKTVPLSNLLVPLGLVGHGHCGNRRVKRHLVIQKLSEEIFKTLRRGIEFEDLRSRRIAKSKTQAQAMLKRCLSGGILFTFGNTRHQQYYPTSRESEVMRYLLSRSVPIDPTGHDLKLEELRQEVRIQTFEFILQKLPKLLWRCITFTYTSALNPVTTKSYP